MLNEQREPSGILYIYDMVIPENALRGRMVHTCVLVNAVKVESDCFYNCPYLKKIIAPKLKYIGDNIIENCPELLEFNAPYLRLNGIEYFGSFLIDKNKKQILNVGNFNQRFVNVISNELKGDAPLSIKENMNGGKSLFNGETLILSTNSKGEINHINLPTAEILPAHALYENKTVEILSILNAKTIDHNAIYKARALTNVVAPMVQRVRFSNFSKCDKLEQIILPKVESMDEGCLSNNPHLTMISCPSLKSAAGGFASYLDKIQEITLPNLEFVGDYSFQYNPQIHTVILPRLETFERGIFYKTGIKSLYAPHVHNRSQSIKYLKNAKHLIRHKDTYPKPYNPYDRQQDN